MTLSCDSLHMLCSQILEKEKNIQHEKVYFWIYGPREDPDQPGCLRISDQSSLFN